MSENKKTDWYKNSVIYQIYPFSFMDKNNDGFGDIEGIVSKLDYLKELGIDAIWFSPLYKSPDHDYGYDISDFKDIDPKFGSLDDFKKMLSLCHEKGIKVIMDMTMNHSSTEHKWFKEALKGKDNPYRDYYIIREGRRKGKKLLPPNNWQSTFTGSAWENIKGTDDFYLHLFCVEQADLNWENEKVRNEFADIFNFWFDMGVDGFRLDVFNMLSKTYPLKDGKKKMAGTGEEFYVDGPRMHEFLKEINSKSFSKYDSYTVGESYNPGKEAAAAYVNKNNHELDTIFNFGHLSSDNSTKYFKKKFNLLQFKDGLFGPQTENYGNGWNTLVLENHDNSRSNSRFGINTEKYHYEASTFLPTVTFLGFGTPFIYMGEEFGMVNAKFDSINECKDPVSHFIHDLLHSFFIPEKICMSFINYGSRDNARVPMKWDDSVNYGFNNGHETWQKEGKPLTEVNLKADRAGKSVFEYYKKLIALKKTDLFINGNIKEYDHENKKIIAFGREAGKETAFVAGNFSDKTVKYKFPSEFAGKKYEIILSNYENPALNNGSITFRPYEAVVLRIK